MLTGSELIQSVLSYEKSKPASPSGAGGAASSALSLGLDDVPASPAASLLASEDAALGAYVTVITNTSTKGKPAIWSMQEVRNGINGGFCYNQ